MSQVAVIDYGMGNLHSISKALQRADSTAEVTIVSDPAAIQNADHVVLPGVGAIRDCMLALKERHLIDVVKQVAANKPFLGVCLGMQALLSHSDENGGVEGLNIISGRVQRFAEPLLGAKGERLKVPHMGWNEVNYLPHPLWQSIPERSRFYFVHSYYAVPSDPSVMIARSDYPDPFACALAHKNVFAVQFHPEKSQSVGLQLLRNFLSWDGTL